MAMNMKVQIKLLCYKQKNRQKRNQIMSKNKNKRRISMNSFLKSIKILSGLDFLPIVLIKKGISCVVYSYVWPMA